MTFTRLATAAAFLACWAGSPTGAHAWAETKCALFRDAWAGALERQGRRGLGQAFLESHEALLASGCATQGGVCPRSFQEVALTDLLRVLAMNEGMASTLLPFGCFE